MWWFKIVWGGSLNEKGSDHIRRLKEAEKTIKFLETIEKSLSIDEKNIVEKTIEIVLKLFTKKTKEES